MNNIERVRESFRVLPMEFSYEKLLVAGEKCNSNVAVEEWRKRIETTIIVCNDDIINRIYQILSKIITNMEMEVKQYLFHLIEAPEASEVQETIQPLFTFLDSQLAPYKEFLIAPNFIR